MTQFLLVCHSPEKVLQTIASRCQSIRVRPLSKEERIGTEESESVYKDLFGQLMTAFGRHDLLDALELGEALAALPSRESAKGFCRYAALRMRRIFLCQQGLAGLGQADADTAAWASAVKKTFPRLSMEALDRAQMQIGRNVNLKILFADLVGRLYTIYG